MDAKQRDFFVAMESLFESTGWKLLTDGWKEESERLAQEVFFNAKDYDDVRDARVRHELLMELLTLPGHIERQKAAIEQNLTDE